jgi:hypothetical protein
VNRDGSFGGDDIELDSQLFVANSVLGPMRGFGWVRIVKTHSDDRGACDTGVVDFSARSP